MPVAVNCCAVPFTMLGVGGVIPMDTNVAAVTVKVTAGEVIPPSAAVMPLVPTAVEAAKPLLPPALLIVATAGEADAQVTELVKFWVVLSV